MNSEETMLTVRQVGDMVGICRSTVYEWMKTRGLPKQVKLVRNHAAWRLSEITEWLHKNPVRKWSRP